MSRLSLVLATTRAPARAAARVFGCSQQPRQELLRSSLMLTFIFCGWSLWTAMLRMQPTQHTHPPTLFPFFYYLRLYRLAGRVSPGPTHNPGGIGPPPLSFPTLLLLPILQPFLGCSHPLPSLALLSAFTSYQHEHMYKGIWHIYSVFVC